MAEEPTDVKRFGIEPFISETLDQMTARLDALQARVAILETGGRRLGPKPITAEDEKRMVEALVSVVRKNVERPESPPVDRSQTTLTDGSPVTADHREIDPTSGQQKGYVVLSAEERAKGFVRPVRRTYVHVSCGASTTMGHALAETYARDPGFYSGTFCATCRQHFPLGQFKWDDGTVVGS